MPVAASAHRSIGSNGAIHRASAQRRDGNGALAGRRRRHSLSVHLLGGQLHRLCTAGHRAGGHAGAGRGRAVRAVVSKPGQSGATGVRTHPGDHGGLCRGPLQPHRGCGLCGADPVGRAGISACRSLPHRRHRHRLCSGIRRLQRQPFSGAGGCHPGRPVHGSRPDCGPEPNRGCHRQLLVHYRLHLSGHRTGHPGHPAHHRTQAGQPATWRGLRPGSAKQPPPGPEMDAGHPGAAAGGHCLAGATRRCAPAPPGHRWHPRLAVHSRAGSDRGSHRRGVWCRVWADERPVSQCRRHHQCHGNHHGFHGRLPGADVFRRPVCGLVQLQSAGTAARHRGRCLAGQPDAPQGGAVAVFRIACRSDQFIDRQRFGQVVYPGAHLRTHADATGHLPGSDPGGLPCG